MKGRGWVIGLFIILLACVAGYYIAVEHYQFDQKFTEYILAGVNEALGMDFEATSIYILPWSFGVRNPRVTLSNMPAILEAERIRIHFNIFSYILHDYRPLLSTRNVYIEKPRVTWKLDETADGNGADGRFDLPSVTLAELPSGHVNLIDGAFFISRNDTVQAVAKNINGWLEGRNDETVAMFLKGHFLSEHSNAVCRGTVNRRDDTFTLSTEIADADLSSGSIDLLTGDIVLEEGMCDISLVLDRTGDTPISVDGDYAIHGGTASLRNSPLRVRDISVSGSISGEKIDFNTLTGKILDVTPVLNGRLTLKPEARLHVTVTGTDMPVHTMYRELFPEHTDVPRGSLSLESTVKGPLRTLDATITLSSDSLAFDGHVIRDIRVDSHFAGGKLSVKQYAFAGAGFDFTGSASSETLFGDNPADERTARIVYTVKNTEKPAVSASGEVDLALNLHDSRYRASFISRIRGSVEGGENDMRAFEESLMGTVSYRGDVLEFAVDDAGRTIGLHGSVDDPFGAPEIDASFEMESFQPLGYFSDTTELVLNGNGTFAGNADNIESRFAVHLDMGRNIDSDLRGDLRMKNILEPSRSAVVDARLVNHHLRFSHPLNWKLFLGVDTETTSLSVVDDEGAALKVAMNNDDRSLNGFLELEALPLEWIIDIFVREEFSHRGVLAGRAEISGTVDEPRFHTPEKFMVTKLKVGGLDSLTGTGYVSGEFGKMSFTDVDIARKGRHIMHADGFWETGTPFVLTAANENIELGALSDLISHDRETYGRLDYDLTMAFTRESGTIDGDFRIEDGAFLGIPFDFADGGFTGGSEGFEITEFSVGKDGYYTGSGTATSGYLWRDTGETSGLRLDLAFEGDLMTAIPYLTDAVAEAHGQSRLDLTFAGTWMDPYIIDGELKVTGGSIRPVALFDRITDATVHLDIDEEIETISGLTGVKVLSGTGSMGGKRVVVESLHGSDSEWSRMHTVKPYVLSIVNGTVDLDFGVLRVMLEQGAAENATIETHVPGFMYEGDYGTFLLTGDNHEHIYVGAVESDDDLAPYIAGTIDVLSGDITYPLLETGDGDGSLGFAGDIFWDISVTAGSNVNYARENNITFGALAGTTIFRTLARMDETTEFTVFGSLNDDTFRVDGNAYSTSGTVTFYGAEFDIERAELEVDTENTVQPARLTARARTTVYNDSTGVHTEVVMHMYSIDRDSGKRRSARGGVQVTTNVEDLVFNRTVDLGPLGIVEYEFTSNNPSDDTQEKILASLGISPSNFGAAATRAFTAGMDNYYFNPLMRPFENRVRHYTRLDVVRFTPSLLGNIVRNQLKFSSVFGPDTEYMMFDGSRVMVGEYFMNDWFLSYEAQYGLGRNYLNKTERGFYHELALQYLLERNTRLQLNYNYDEVISRGDKRLEIRHDFEF